MPMVQEANRYLVGGINPFENFLFFFLWIMSPIFGVKNEKNWKPPLRICLSVFFGSLHSDFFGFTPICFFGIQMQVSWTRLGKLASEKGANGSHARQEGQNNQYEEAAVERRTRVCIILLQGSICWAIVFFDLACCMTATATVKIFEKIHHVFRSRWQRVPSTSTLNN